ncbi:MAG: nucleoside kinase [Syntrophomonadaceae bacterium]|nr:nucleoside kinase [Syntrophomonadaceae bacterium]
MNKYVTPALIDVVVDGCGIIQVEAGSTLEQLVARLDMQDKNLVMAGVVNNNLVDLNYYLNESDQVKLITMKSEIGLRVYRRSAVFLLIVAARMEFPDRKITIKHSLSNGLLCEFVDGVTNESEVKKLEARMRKLVDMDLPVHRNTIMSEQAMEIFARQQQYDKVKLLEVRGKPVVHVYELDGWYEYFYGYMVPRTGMISHFKLIYYSPGIILQTPESHNPTAIEPYIEQKQLARVFREARDWSDMLQTPHVAALNDIIANGNIEEIIRVNEALHEKKIAYIADQICQQKDARLVLIAGPSSSGKTTFAQRLFIQLRVNGRRPVLISMDNYFVDRALTPRDENGEYDFESLHALKLDLFNSHLISLIRGDEVEVPVFNFKTGECDAHGIPIKVNSGQPIIVEGIHALNDELTWLIPPEQKFKVYISALTQLNIDYSNRIPTTDSRLIRRIVRDARTRGYCAADTISRWPSVRAGEQKYIFPYQENADVMFNSSLVYELAVLKPYAEPLLQAISPEADEYVESKRLLKFFSYFKPISGDPIPPNSIIREFIGGSWFKA